MRLVDANRGRDRESLTSKMVDANRGSRVAIVTSCSAEGEARIAKRESRAALCVSYRKCVAPTRRPPRSTSDGGCRPSAYQGAAVVDKPARAAVSALTSPAGNRSHQSVADPLRHPPRSDATTGTRRQMLRG